MSNDTLTSLAQSISEHAHCGQKYGDHDYYQYHVLGVANQFYWGTNEHITALLHDVVEDSDIDIATIRDLFSFEIGNAVATLTRPVGLTYEGYIDMFDLKSQTLAKTVKIADLKFHLAQPDAKKRKKYDTYVKALTLLEGESQ